MRIVQAIESSGPGGAEQIVASLVRGLTAAGHDVLTLLLRPGWLEQRLVAEGARVGRLELTRPLDPGLTRQLRRQLDEFSADVLHTHEFTFAFYGRLATRSSPLAHVATAHGANFLGGFKRRALARLFLRRAERFGLVAVSRSLQEELGRQVSSVGRSMRVLTNGVALEGLASAPSRSPGDDLRLIAVGNLYPVKNHAVLIRAVDRLRRQGVPARLSILGRGADEPLLRAVIAEFDLESCVTLHGFREDVAEFLSQAHVFVSSSLSEGLPLSFIEGMGAGLPVVASNVGGVPEVVRDGTDGVLCEATDPTSFAAALERLATDEPLRRRLGQNARERARREFSIDAMLSSYEGLYRKLRGAC